MLDNKEERQTKDKKWQRSVGVIKILGIAKWDFDRMAKDMTELEDIAYKNFREFKAEAELKIAVFKKQIEYLEKRKLRNKMEKLDLERDLKGEQKEAKAVEEYLKSLHSSCTIMGPTYEERKARREQELEGLKDALQVLEGDSIAVSE